MYLIIVREEHDWVVHTKPAKKEEDLWTEIEAEKELKALMGQGKAVKTFKAEKADIRIKLESEAK